MKTAVPLGLSLVPILTSSIFAQSGGGYIGIYRDSLGTQACTSVPAYTSSTLYVIGKLAGQTASGITGTEFRIEVTAPSGWYISYNAPSAANVVSGNAIDTDPDPNAGGGVTLAFASCQVPNAGGRINLGTVSIFNASGSTTKLLVKRHTHPTNAGFACPLFVKCDDPYFTKVCMTSAPPDSCTLSTQKAMVATADDPTIFVALLNESGGETTGPPSAPEREVLALFAPGIVLLPSGQTYASLASTTINSTAIASVLESYSIEGIAKAFPFFDLADTVAVARTGETVRLQNLSEIYKLRMPEGGNPTLLAEDLTAVTDEVGYAEPNGTATLLANCVDDPYFNLQWSLNNEGASACTASTDIDSCNAYTITPGSASTKIAILDTGVDSSHPDLTGKVSGDPGFVDEHGTIVAGIAAAFTNNAIGIAGVDGNAQILSQRVFGLDMDDADRATGVRDAASLGAVVLNNSWRLGAYSSTVRGAFRDVYLRNCVATAAMGNNYGEHMFYPAAFGQGIIAVGATDCNDAHWISSTTGSHIDVAAPGVDIWSTAPQSIISGGYTHGNGTSYATPHVSGLAGLLLSYGSFIGTTLYNDDIEQLIRLSADDVNEATFPGPDSLLGMGRINADRALSLLQLPNKLFQWTASDGDVTASSGPSLQWFYVPPKPHPAGLYGFYRYEVQKEVIFPVTFAATPNVWGRGAASIGYDSSSPNWCMGWCEVVPGTIRESGCKLRTFVYYVDNGVEPLGWWPTDPGNAQFAYTVLGTVASTDGGNSPDPIIAPSLLSTNPLRRGATIAVAIPQPGKVRLDVFDVAGRRVRVLQDGELSRGQHELKWNGLSSTGKALAAGLYLARLTTQSGVVTRKLLLLE